MGYNEVILLYISLAALFFFINLDPDLVLKDDETNHQFNT